jgi:hypothetical protein
MTFSRKQPCALKGGNQLGVGSSALWITVILRRECWNPNLHIKMLTDYLAMCLRTKLNPEAQELIDS